MFMSQSKRLIALSVLLVFTMLAAPGPAQATARPGAMSIWAKASFSTAEKVVLYWTAATNTTKYGCSVWKYPYGSDNYLVFDQFVTGTSVNIGTLSAGSYRAQMMAYGLGGTGPASNIIYFTVNTPSANTTSSSTGKQKQDKWFAGAVGRYINPDGMYGYQCVDVADDYCIALFGNYASTLGTGNAGTLFDKANSKYFTKIRNNPNDPNQIPCHGDIIVFNNHIAVVDSANTKSVTVLHQNYNGDDPRFPCARGNMSYAGVIGWLRPQI